jgi:flagellar hook-associated protein 2
MSTTSIFSGNSRYASDFQSVIDRSVAIASLPLQQLNSTKSLLSSQSTAVTALDAKFAALQKAIEGLQSTAVDHPFAASVQDESILGATVSSGAMEGSYTLEVVSLGANTVSLSSDGLTTVSDPTQQSLSAAPSLSLTVDGNTFEVTPESPSLIGLATAINRLEDSGVRATVVNVGSSASPDYRLSLQSTKLAPVTIQLQDGANSLMTLLANGSNAVYRVNGMGRDIQSDSRTVALAPGLEVTLRGESEPGQPTTVSVTRDSTALADSLSAFVQAYNSVLGELDAHRGKDAGALSGQSLVFSLSEALRRMGNYGSDSPSASSLRALGITADQTGLLSLDAAVLQKANAGAVLEFLGTAAGTGFLGAATDVLNSIEDPETGSVKVALQGIEKEMAAQDKLIEENQGRIDDLRERLAAQMAAADALIASLEQQVSYITGLFQAMTANNQSTR